MPPSKGQTRKSAQHRELLFVEEYLIDMKPTQAAVRVGIPHANAAHWASRIMKKVHIRNRIEVALAERSRRTNIRADEVLEELRIVGKSSVEHYDVDDNGNVTLAEGAPDGALRAVSKIKKRVRTIRRNDEEDEVIRETEISLYDKNGAIRMMGQHLAMFTEVTKGTVDHNHVHTWKVGDKEITF